jgi:hypothetical protein
MPFDSADKRGVIKNSYCEIRVTERGFGTLNQSKRGLQFPWYTALEFLRADYAAKEYREIRGTGANIDGRKIKSTA